MFWGLYYLIYRTEILTPKSKENHLATWEGDDGGFKFWSRVIPRVPNTVTYNEHLKMNRDAPLKVVCFQLA